MFRFFSLADYIQYLKVLLLFLWVLFSIEENSGLCIYTQPHTHCVYAICSEIKLEIKGLFNNYSAVKKIGQGLTGPTLIF